MPETKVRFLDLAFIAAFFMVAWAVHRLSDPPPSVPACGCPCCPRAERGTL